MTTVYDVTTWSVPGNPSATPYNDIGLIMNSIIADIKSQQTSQASKPGAVIYIPPGDYSLKTRVNVDISFLTIRGAGHGFTSLSIRYNAGSTSGWHEINPGGSRVRGKTPTGTPTPSGSTAPGIHGSARWYSKTSASTECPSGPTRTITPTAKQASASILPTIPAGSKAWEWCISSMASW